MTYLIGNLTGNDIERKKRSKDVRNQKWNLGFKERKGNSDLEREGKLRELMYLGILRLI